MTDTHTHILPGMDDGAADLTESLRMLRKCRAQGVKTVVLTPHFYPERESVDSFLARREAAFEQLRKELPPDFPELVLGAEVAWCPGLQNMPQLTQLTMGQSSYLLLEMPYMSWTEEQVNGIWRLLNDGRVVPVMAHVDRYLHMQKNGQFEAVLNLQVPLQMSGVAFQKLFRRAKALQLMSKGQWMVGSDCHNLTDRPPCMAAAKRYIQAHAPEKAAALYWEF